MEIDNSLVLQRVSNALMRTWENIDLYIDQCDDDAERIKANEVRRRIVNTYDILHNLFREELKGDA